MFRGKAKQSKASVPNVKLHTAERVFFVLLLEGELTLNAVFLYSKKKESSEGERKAISSAALPPDRLSLSFFFLFLFLYVYVSFSAFPSLAIGVALHFFSTGPHPFCAYVVRIETPRRKLAFFCVCVCRVVLFSSFFCSCFAQRDRRLVHIFKHIHTQTHTE